MGLPLVMAESLNKEFNGTLALEGFSIEVNPGIFGLVGPNGAGKTTFLRILLGLLRADSGTAEIFGLDVSEDSIEIRRRIGILHENPSFPKHMTALGFLYHIKRLFKNPQAPEDLLAAVGLDQEGNRKIGALSAGMHQRLGIAQALIGNPELVFLDEPTSNLDVAGRSEILKLVMELNHQRGISFFISSHILSELERACHDVAFIKEGRVIEKGKMLDIVRKRTAHSYRIVASDPRSLLNEVRNMRGVHNCVLSGTNTITVEIQQGNREKVESDVKAVAKGLNIEIYAVNQASTLEDAYREVMQ